MRNITRNNYDPHIGDYHNRIVHDEARGKIWLFDCDGVFLDMSKTNVRVVNEYGQSEEYAIGQKFFTDEMAATNATIITVDEASQARDADITNDLNEATETLQANINTVNTNAITRDTQLANTLNAHVTALDNDVENLTDITTQNAANITTINSTAVFGVTLNQGENISLAVVDGGQTTTTTIREAASNRSGLMPASSYAQVVKNTEDIQKLQNAGLYRGSFATVADAPTSTPDPAFIGGEAYPNDVVTIREATFEGETGVARYRISVGTGGAVTYSFDHFIDKDIANFSLNNPGLIVGSNADGEVGATSAGKGTVNGWSQVKADISANTDDIATNAQNITTNTSDITALGTRMTTAETAATSLTTRVTTAEENITTNTQNISANSTGIAAIKAKAVEASTPTTIGSNTEGLLTASGMMNHWVDITESGLPQNPDANTFYYTVEV